MTFKTVLNEGKPSILHRVVKSDRFDLHRARFCPQLRPLHPLSPNALRWSAASRFVVFGRSALRSRRVRPLLTTELYIRQTLKVTTQLISTVC